MSRTILLLAIVTLPVSLNGAAPHAPRAGITPTLALPRPPPARLPVRTVSAPPARAGASKPSNGARSDTGLNGFSSYSSVSLTTTLY
ncbi:hypothetical protein [Pyxidicoccus xibeiensis]|uniref:hypothetical protein n=1 Tax=Pyxidicoccus xibeiensis TaxID=2906759 RepID=UPI0020A7FC95|nr:hypothetical protein [Pyxidicoccus xibeiensis]MCP3138192.1 hypothetical protein [Pyxidicoccus xibeiensis]